MLACRYRIDAYLAAGGMGQVYRAHDLELDVPLALKTIHPVIASNPASLRSFKQEVLLARAVTHPNVCRIFDLWRDEASDVSFLTMEFLPGETLASRIERKGPVPSAESLPLVRQMAEALDAAHRAGIVHRDFKSPNVMVVPNGNGDRAVITDFGLAMAVEKDRNSDLAELPATELVSAPGSELASDGEDTHASQVLDETVAFEATNAAPGAIVGTPAYMSPEQVRGGVIGPATDLYALGVILFEMCTGQLPFRGATPAETAQAHLTTEPPSPSALAELEETWERTILRLLSKQPEERYPTAHDVVLALEGRFEDGKATRYFLPAEQDAFVGRTSELEKLARHLRTEARLLTLQGPGGTGKTRLVTKYGWENVNRWPGGVWFCDLSEARTADGIAVAVAKSLNVSLGMDDPIAQLGHVIAARERCLLILDNFEQVVAHAEATLAPWLARATDANFLVTSRERLRLPQETVLELEPLDPTTQGVDLFEVRAQSHRPGFAVDDSNRPRVEEIVESLDGLPLAIELAAARLRMLNLDQLHDRLQDRFRILSGGKKGRHAALRTTLDWSWDLLQPWERSAMAQVSVFEGGFTLEAAEAVIDLSNFEDDPFVLDVIQSLVDKSWLRAKVAHGAPRFDMYVTVQEYASAMLGPPSADASEAEIRHGVHFAGLGTDEAIESLERHGGVQKRAVLRSELDNLVAACRRAIVRGDEDAAAGSYLAAAALLELQGPFMLSVQLGSEVLEVLKEPSRRGRVFRFLAEAERAAGQMGETRVHYEAALAAAREVSDRRLEGVVLGNLGNLFLELGQMEDARAHYEAALAIHRELGNRGFEGRALGSLGLLNLELGRMDEARADNEAALAIHREVGNRSYEGIVLGHLGILHRDQDRLEEARAHYEAAVAIQREVGDRRFEGVVLGNVGLLLADQGRMEEAGAHYEAALAIHREVGNRRSEGVLLGNMGSLHKTQGRPVEARAHYEAALVIHREVGNRGSESVVLGHLGRLHASQNRTDDARDCFDAALTIRRDGGNDVDVGEVLCALGELEHQLGNREEARAILVEAETIAADQNVEIESELGRAVEELRRLLGGTPS